MVVLNRMFFVLIFLIVGEIALTQDIRSKVVTGNAGISISTILDPNLGIFNIPFGTTEDQLIDVFGRPSGYFSLMNDVSLMVYGYRTTFLFRAKQLAGLTIADHLIPYELRGIVRPSDFDKLNWSLSNGIRAQTSLSKVKQILNLPDIQLGQNQRLVFDKDGTTIVLIFGRQLRFDATGRELVDYLDSDYSVDSLYFVRTETLPFLGIKLSD